MSKREGSNTSKGIGLFNLLGVVFIVLKLCHVIDWSWWYVTMPLYGPYALIVVIFIVAALIIGAIDIIESMVEEKKKKKNIS
ncbi:hypothetical protein [Paenibacillus sp. MMO-58]|uniref:hypothetical protein n=1 Tax=Paenibacillus sp. MMO-58 TaxID=3081290 RepID=UPI003016C51B